MLFLQLYFMSVLKIAIDHLLLHDPKVVRIGRDFVTRPAPSSFWWQLYVFSKWSVKLCRSCRCLCLWTSWPSFAITAYQRVQVLRYAVRQQNAWCECVTMIWPSFHSDSINKLLDERSQTGNWRWLWRPIKGKQITFICHNLMYDYLVHNLVHLNWKSRNSSINWKS